MPDYKNGKIYCLRSYKTNMIYIGSTTQSLSQRLGGHKKDYKRWLKTNKKYTSSVEIIKQGDCYIELIEYCECKTRAELCKKEGEFIRKMDCINKRFEARTIEEIKQYHQKYRQKNIKQIKQREKKYRQKTKEYQNKRNKEYYERNKELLREKALERYYTKKLKKEWKKKFDEVLKNIK